MHWLQLEAGQGITSQPAASPRASGFCPTPVSTSRFKLEPISSLTFGVVLQLLAAVEQHDVLRCHSGCITRQGARQAGGTVTLQRCTLCMKRLRGTSSSTGTSSMPTGAPRQGTQPCPAAQRPATTHLRPPPRQPSSLPAPRCSRPPKTRSASPPPAHDHVCEQQAGEGEGSCSGTA